MNKDDFYKYIKNPSELDDWSINELHEILIKYPYFQSAHLLYLKNLYKFDRQHFDTQLKISSAYISDRKILHQLINDRKFMESDEMNEVNTPLNELVKQEIRQHLIDHQVAIANQDKKDAQEIIHERQQVMDVDEDPKEEINREDVSADTDSQQTDLSMIEFLDEQSTKPVFSEDDLSGKIFYQIQQIRSLISEKEAEERFLKSKENENAEEDNYFELDLDGETAPETPVEDEKSIIERFLQATPSIKPVKEDKPLEDISEPSSQEKDDLITETLVKIYIKQKLYQKAINSYEKLSLRFPEKKSYFAAQIEKLKNIINEQKNN